MAKWKHRASDKTELVAEVATFLRPDQAITNMMLLLASVRELNYFYRALCLTPFLPMCGFMCCTGIGAGVEFAESSNVGRFN